MKNKKNSQNNNAKQNNSNSHSLWVPALETFLTNPSSTATLASQLGQRQFHY